MDRPTLKLMMTRTKAVPLREPRLPRAHRRTRSERRKWWNCREAGRLERPHPPPRQATLTSVSSKDQAQLPF